MNFAILRVDTIPNGHDSQSSGNVGTVGGMEGGESKKRKYPSDRSYFIAKEILTTERTYKKDLEVLNVVSLRCFYDVSSHIL